jgi:hypothetical protein
MAKVLCNTGILKSGKTTIVVEHGYAKAAKECGRTRNHIRQVAIGRRIGSKRVNAAIVKYCPVKIVEE